MDVVNFETWVQFAGFSIQLSWSVDLEISAVLMDLGMSLPTILGSKYFITILAFIIVAGAISSFHMTA